MSVDPIVEEVRAVRDRLAARFDYDIASILRHLRELETTSGVRHVECPPGGLAEECEQPVRSDSARAGGHPPDGT